MESLPCSSAVMQAPVVALMEVTSKCNLRCSYCFHFDSVTEHCKDLSKDEWLQFFAELQSLKVFTITLTGGEPFVRPDFLDLCQGASELGLRYRILSNATLITDADAARLAKIGRCSAVQVSLDGIGEINDAARGKGAFDKAVRGIRHLLNHGINVFPRVTLSHHNLGHLEEFADFIVNELKIPHFGTNMATVMGENGKNAAELEYNIHQYADAMREHQIVNKKYPGVIQAFAGPGAMLRHWKTALKAKRDNIPMVHGGFHSTCSLVYQRICVRPDGGILACSAFPEQVMGYINQDSLSDIWRNGKFINEMRKFRHKPLTDYANCATCEYRPWCGGGCPAIVLQYISNDSTSCAGHTCLRKFLAVEPDFDFELDK